MVAKGVESSWLETVGYGESNPIATNKTKEGRYENRRIELTLQK
jgi:OOP family OmpA-OmpF porin